MSIQSELDAVETICKRIEVLQEEKTKLLDWIASQHAPLQPGDVATVNQYSHNGKEFKVGRVFIKIEFFGGVLRGADWCATGSVIRKFDGQPIEKRGVLWRQNILWWCHSCDRTNRAGHACEKCSRENSTYKVF